MEINNITNTNFTGTFILKPQTKQVKEAIPNIIMFQFQIASRNVLRQFKALKIELRLYIRLHGLLLSFSGRWVSHPATNLSAQLFRVTRTTAASPK